MARRFTRLTRSAIRRMSSGDQITENCICAEKLADGDIRYSVNFMVDGQRVHRSIGRESDGVRLATCERQIEKWRTEAREGRLDLPQGRKLHRTFRESATEYLDHLDSTLSEGQKGFRDLPNKRRHIEQHLIPHFGKKRLDQIGELDVQRYIRARLATVAQATVNRELSTLSHFLNRAIEWKWLRRDSRPTITKGDEPTKKIEILTDAEISALRKGAAGDQGPYTWLFVEFGLNTAMRHEEIVSARYDRIDFDHHRLFVPIAKAGTREQPLTPSLVEALRRQRDVEDDPNGWIFPSSRASTGHIRDMDRQFRRAVVRAGLNPKRVTPHVMRHTAVSRLVMAGIDIPTIQKVSGHKTVQMVMRYVHIFGQHVDKAAAVLDTAKLDAITPELHDQQKVVAIASAKTSPTSD